MRRGVAGIDCPMDRIFSAVALRRPLLNIGGLALAPAHRPPPYGQRKALLSSPIRFTRAQGMLS